MRSKATEDNVVRLCCITPGLSRLITRTCTRVGRIRSIPYRSVRTFSLPLFSTLRLKALEEGGEGDQRFIIDFLEREEPRDRFHFRRSHLFCKITLAQVGWQPVLCGDLSSFPLTRQISREENEREGEI